MEVCAKNLSSEKTTVITLVGGPGSGKTSVAHALARSAGRRVLRVSPASILDPRRSISDNLGVLRNLSEVLQAVVLLEPAEDFFPEANAWVRLAII